MPLSPASPRQIPLIHVVESDDLYLANQSDVLWFDLLRNLPWEPFVPIGIEYYESLWHFNQNQADQRQQRAASASMSASNPETETEASLRLVMERPTQGAPRPLVEPPPLRPLDPLHVDPAEIRPGHVPFRIAGRAPKCFFAMFKAFVGIILRGRVPEPEEVAEELRSNPGFARICGFTLPQSHDGYRQSHIPSLRKLEQFDQIMTQNKLWQKAAVGQVADNLKTAHLSPDTTLVHDTTHYHAFSSMRTVEISDKDETSSSQKPKRKSHPRSTKNCRCKHRANCPHPWVSADLGAGTVVKAGGQMHWAHKASTLSFSAKDSNQEILLDVVAMTDAASSDSKSLLPHIERFRTLYPGLEIKRVLDDSAADDQNLKDKLAQDFGIELLTSPNPRRRKPLRTNLPRGIDHIRSTGTPVCVQGLPFDFLGCRNSSGHFLFRSPLDQQGNPICQGCPKKSDCCRDGSARRQIAVAFDRLPWIDPRFPQLSRRFHKAIAQRTVIERIHKLMKYDYGDDRLTKRGNPAFQARLDKTLLAMHLVLSLP